MANVWSPKVYRIVSALWDHALATAWISQIILKFNKVNYDISHVDNMKNQSVVPYLKGVSGCRDYPAHVVATIWSPKVYRIVSALWDHSLATAWILQIMLVFKSIKLIVLIMISVMSIIWKINLSSRIWRSFRKQRLSCPRHGDRLISPKVYRIVSALWNHSLAIAWISQIMLIFNKINCINNDITHVDNMKNQSVVSYLKGS